MTPPADPKNVLPPEAPERVFRVPIRRSVWPSFWIAAITNLLSLLTAAGGSALLMASFQRPNGTLIVITFALLWGGQFFLSFPWQRRLARSLDLGRPGISLSHAVLTIPLRDDAMLQFKLDEPYELRFGWSDFVAATIASPTMHTRTFLTYAGLSQDSQQVFLKAEDSTRAARVAGWPKHESVEPTTPEVRLWANDLVALVETIRTQRAV